MKKVTEITPFSGEYVTVEGEQYIQYRRMGPDNWEALMGQSWETEFFADEIEAAYQEFKARNP